MYRALIGVGAVLALMSGAPAELGHAASPAASESLPPLVQPPTRRHEVGKIVWLDLLTPDVRAEQQFYAGLFGWRFRDLQVGSSVYAIASIDGEPVAGLLQRPLPPNMQRRPAWLPFLSVGNAEAIKQQALAHGARVISDVRDYRQRGRQAILADPQGAVFAVLQSSAGDPPDALPTPGECIWGTLFARDPAEEAGFYQALFGYEVYPLVDPPTASMASTASSAGPAQERRELVLGSGGFARASIDELPASDHAPQWLAFVRVSDVAAAVQRATMLGGRVLVTPRAARFGRLAVIADPSGAPIGLLQWARTGASPGS